MALSDDGGYVVPREIGLENCSLDEISLVYLNEGQIVSRLRENNGKQVLVEDRHRGLVLGDFLITQHPSLYWVGGHQRVELNYYDILSMFVIKPKS